MNLPGFKDPNKNKETQTYEAKVGEITVTATSPEGLKQAVEQIQGIKPQENKSLKPNPLNQQQQQQQQGPQQNQGPQAQQQQTQNQDGEKWTSEQFLTALRGGDLHGAIMTVISQSLGVKSLSESMTQLTNNIGYIFNFAQEVAISQALAANGAEINQENVGLFKRLIATQPQEKQAPTIGNLMELAKEATTNEWIAKKAPEGQQQQQQQGEQGEQNQQQQQTQQQQQSTEGQEKTFPTRSVGPQVETTQTGNIEEKTLAELETYVDSTPVDQLIAEITG